MKKTTYLQLNAFDSGSLTYGSGSTVSIYNYINLVSGSQISGSSNPPIIDAFAGRTSSSCAGISASTIRLSASMIYASASQTSAGSSAAAFLSPYSLGYGDYGKMTCCIPLNSSGSLSGGEINLLSIPYNLDGWILVDAAAYCAGSSSSGSPSFAVEKYSNIASPISTSSSSITMLNGNLIIDEGKFDTVTSVIPTTISATGSSVFTGNKIKVKVITAGTGTTYAGVSLTFQKYN